MGTKPVLPGYVMKSVATKDADGAWIKQVREPGEVFEAPAAHIVKGISALVDGEGRTLAKWIKTSLDAGGVDYIAAIKAAFADVAPRPVIGRAGRDERRAFDGLSDRGST